MDPDQTTPIGAILVHIVCHRGYLNVSADEKSRRLFHFSDQSESLQTFNSMLKKLSNITDEFKYRSKQGGPRSDFSYRSSLIWVHTVCHRGFLNVSADEKSRRLFHFSDQSESLQTFNSMLNIRLF